MPPDRPAPSQPTTRSPWIRGDEFDPSMKDLVQRKIAELRAQLKSVEARLARCESAAPLSEQDVQARVDETTATLRSLGESLGDAPPATLNRFLQVFISKLVVDLETRDVEVEIAVPAHLDAGCIEMRLVEGLVCKASNEAHQDGLPAIAAYTGWRGNPASDGMTPRDGQAAP